MSEAGADKKLLEFVDKLFDAYDKDKNLKLDAAEVKQLLVDNTDKPVT